MPLTHTRCGHDIKVSCHDIKVSCRGVQVACWSGCGCWCTLWHMLHMPSYKSTALQHWCNSGATLMQQWCDSRQTCPWQQAAGPWTLDTPRVLQYNVAGLYNAVGLYSWPTIYILDLETHCNTLQHAATLDPLSIFLTHCLHTYHPSNYHQSNTATASWLHQPTTPPCTLQQPTTPHDARQQGQAARQPPCNKSTPQ